MRYVLLCPSAYIVTIKALQFANVSKPCSEPVSHESFLSDKGFQNIFHMLFFLVTEIHASINLCFKWKRWDIWDFILATKIDQFYFYVRDSYSKNWSDVTWLCSTIGFLFKATKMTSMSSSSDLISLSSSMKYLSILTFEKVIPSMMFKYLSILTLWTEYLFLWHWSVSEICRGLANKRGIVDLISLNFYT